MSIIKPGEARFSFEAANLVPEAFDVVSFRGEEELSRLYRFELDLLSEDPNLDYSKIVNHPATLTIKRFDSKVPINGIVVDFEQMGQYQGVVQYRAVLCPKLWRLSLNHQSRIFQYQSVEEIITDVLKKAGFAPSSDFKFELKESYEAREYCVQYNETDLNFISRLAEFEGIAFFFEQGTSKETIVFADKKDTFANIPDTSTLSYHREEQGVTDFKEHVQNFVCRERIVTGKVILKDYNYRNPDTDLTVESQLNADMPGLQYLYGGNYREVATGKRLVRVRNEEIECTRRVMQGTSDCPGLQTGFQFKLADHYRSDLNEVYLLTRVEHRGSQAGALGLTGPGEEDISYENAFSCIPASTQFRPPRESYVPRIPGVMTGVVVGDGDYGEVDSDGRYHANLHFDPDQGGSQPIRMSQPYTGSGDAGFLLHHKKGTELLLAHHEGDPDRPYAIGSGPNPNHPTPVNSGNNSQHIFRTTSKNLFLIEDMKDKERITLHTPRFNSILSLGDKHSGNEGCTLTTEEKSFIHGAKGIGMHAPGGGFMLSAWPGYGDAKIGEEISKALPVVTAIIGAATGKFIDSADTPFGTVVKLVKKANDLWGKASMAAKAMNWAGEKNVYTKFFDQLGTPGIFATAQGGIDFVNTEGYTITTGGGYSLLTPAEIKLTAADDIGISTGASVSTFARHGHIQMVADSKDILMKANSSNIVGRAKKGIVYSAGNSIYLSAGDVTDDLKHTSFGSVGKSIINSFTKKDKTEEKEYKLPPTDQDSRIQLNAKDGVFINGENGHVIIQSDSKEVALGGKKVAVGGENGVEIFDDNNQIHLKCGQSELIMKKDGTITLKGMKISVEADMTLNMKGGTAVNINTDGKLTEQGSMMEANGKSLHIIKGGLVKIN